jgi:hypothetical protein
MKTYECPECGSVERAEDWLDCGKGHKAVGMYQVLDWGKNGEPILKQQDLPIEK